MRSGVVFLIAVLSLAATAVADIGYASASVRSGYDYGGTYVTGERAVVARSVVMAPGDRLVVAANLLTAPTTFTTYDLYVVNGGDRFALLDGDEPRVVYEHIADMDTQGCCAQGTLVWDRPDDAFASRARTSLLEDGGTTPEEFRAMEHSFLDQPERIDLVWVFTYRPDAPRPSTQEEERAVAAKLEANQQQRLAFQRVFDPGYPSVYDGNVRAAHTAAVAMMGLLALIASGALILWALRLRRAEFEPDGVGTESLLRLYDAVGTYLASLRDILLGGLVVLLGIALHVALLGEPQTQYHLLRAAGIGVAASSALQLVLMLLYASIVVVWSYAILSVSRALRRWRSRRADPPLDLGTA